MAETQFAEGMTPLDLLMPGGYIGAVLVFPTTEPPSDLLTKFQNGLDLVCKRIPWLMGQVFQTSTAEGQKPSLEIRWTATDAAPRIVDKGTLSATYEELSQVKVPLESIPSDMWPTPGQVQAELGSGSGAPVFGANFFRFTNGKAVGLCVQTHHNSMDGFGFAEIINLWAQFMSEPESQVPSFSFASERNTRLAKAIGQNPNTASLDELFEKHPEYSRIPPVLPTEFASCTSEILTISMKKIETYKESLKPHLETTPSTNTVACALLWSAITRARMRRTPDLEHKTSRLPMAVNGRKRLDPSLADHQNPYLGNMVLFSTAEQPARSVCDCSTANSAVLLADICRAVAQAQSPERINGTHIREVHHLAHEINDHRTIFPGWELFGSRDLFITSWADLNFYEFEFGSGLGKPEFVRIPYAQADGNVIILPRKRNVDGPVSSQVIEAVIMLQRQDLDVLKEDSLWEKL
ncbi:transferase family-domain-containing protein [Hypoxylon trugodes]|uniref:transferase family-domain-containing protein n=1 Tax=Hypoxylon trugodes TaxID=326681 RepID=UPI00219B66D0|nr:transferase family-domain-containing protein [Hypoxylon trugodes]KAI1383449.1 transferase family-domain-containing protein [Hypoxylon trugodes]